MFDEPLTGLHPLDVATLVGVFDRLLAAGAELIVIFPAAARRTLVDQVVPLPAPAVPAEAAKTEERRTGSADPPQPSPGKVVFLGDDAGYHARYGPDCG